MRLKLFSGERVGCARIKMLHPVNSPPRLVFHVLEETDQLVFGFRDTNNWRRCFSDGPHLLDPSSQQQVKHPRPVFAGVNIEA